MRLSLQYPIQPVGFSQRFGDNPQFYSDSKYGGLKGHNGIDFFANHGQPVFAAHDGMASFQIDSGGGHGVVIVTNDQFDYEDGQVLFKTIYWHLADGLKEPKYQSPIADKTGYVPVKAGQLIGYADNTGASTGDHLHFGLKPVAKGEDWGSVYNVSQNNGYGGAINPMPYFANIEALQDQLTATRVKLVDVLNLFVKYLRGQVTPQNKTTL